MHDSGYDNPSSYFGRDTAGSSLPPNRPQEGKWGRVTSFNIVAAEAYG